MSQIFVVTFRNLYIVVALFFVIQSLNYDGEVNCPNNFVLLENLPVEVNSVFPGLGYCQRFVRFSIRIYGEFNLCLQIQVLLLLSQLLTS